MLDPRHGRPQRNILYESAVAPSETGHIYDSFAALRERGLVKRLKRATIHEPAVYARQDAPARSGPLVDVTLAQLVGRLLAGKPMTTPELTVAVLESGYETSMAKTTLRNQITRLLGRGGFKVVGGRWVG